MNCGCCKDLGCFAYQQGITFPSGSGLIRSIGDASDYVFHIWSNGGYSTVNTTFLPGTTLTLPFNFNENSETTIKIELPSDYQDELNGISFVTTSDGACCFTVRGLISQCS
jgi:hypothetical protein